MAVSHKDIRLALRGIMLNITGIPSNRAYENVAFTPPEPKSGNAWMRETYLPSDQRRVGTNLIRADGIVQYDLFYPQGTATNKADDDADAIIAEMKPGASTGVENLVIERARRLQGRQENAWYHVPVEIHWRFHGAND